MGKRSNVSQRETAIAQRIWGGISQAALDSLEQLVERFGISVSSGDVQLLGGSWYITHAGLLRISQRRHCSGIKSALIERYSDPVMARWVFKAVVHKTARSRGFVGYGDADPSNVSPLVRGAEMRIAETRAVNRALRKAYGIGLCSVEELGFPSSTPEPARDKGIDSSHSNGNGSGNGRPRLRDRLCLLIRQHQLDPAMVKRFAAEFCGTQELREAGRELVESFITHLSEWAARDRAGLVSKLNSYATPQEVKP